MPKCPNGKKHCDCTPEELRQAALRNKPKIDVPRVLPIKQEHESEGSKIFILIYRIIGLGVKGKGSVLVLLSPRNTGKSQTLAC